MARSGAARSDQRGSTPAPVSKSRARTAKASAMALDALIHERVRLAIVSALAVNESLSLIELRDLIGATDGHQSVPPPQREDAVAVPDEQAAHALGEG